jgi:hypothetical protein
MNGAFLHTWQCHSDITYGVEIELFTWHRPRFRLVRIRRNQRVLVASTTITKGAE